MINEYNGLSFINIFSSKKQCKLNRTVSPSQGTVNVARVQPSYKWMPMVMMLIHAFHKESFFMCTIKQFSFFYGQMLDIHKYIQLYSHISFGLPLSQLTLQNIMLRILLLRLQSIVNGAPEKSIVSLT